MHASSIKSIKHKENQGLYIIPSLAFPSTQALATCPSKVSQGQILQSVPKGLDIKGSSINNRKQKENQGIHNAILRFPLNSGSWTFKIETAT